MIRKINLQQGSHEWLNFRKSGVGASEIASIAGVPGAFQKRSDVLAEKLGSARTLTEFQKKIFADGHEWEALVRENLNASGHSFQPMVVIYSQNDRLFASLDGLDEEAGEILEVKSVISRDRFEQYLEEIPAHYMAQVQWQMMVCEIPTAKIAFVHAGEVAIREVEKDANIQIELYGHAVKFLEELDGIRSGTLPMPFQFLEGQDMDRLAFLKKQEREMKVQLAMVEEEVKALAERILEAQKANKVESQAVSVQWVERQGSIDYGKIPELKGLDLGKYRKKPSRFVQVLLKGGA